MQRLSFELWLRACDGDCVELYGVSIHDLPDWSFRDAYDEGLSARDAAVAAWHAAHYEDDEEDEEDA